MAAGFSIFDISAGRLADELARELHVLAALHERQRHPVDAEAQREIEVLLVLLGERPDRQHGVGQADALAARQRAADQHRGVDARRRSCRSTRMRILPSSSSSVWPGSTASKICGCGRNTRSAPPSLSVVSKRKVAPSASATRSPPMLPTRNFGPCRSAQDADRPAEVGLRGAHGRVHLLHHVEGGVAHVDAEHVDARLEQALDHLRGVRRRSEGGDDLDAPRCVSFGFSAPFAGIGQADGPVLGFLGVHLEEAGALIAAPAAVLNPPDGERLVGRAHDGLAGPLPAAVVVDGVDVIEAARQRALVERLAGLRRRCSTSLPWSSRSGPDSRWRRRCGSRWCCTA